MCDVGGRTHGVPWLGGTRALFYNKELFERAGIDSSHSPETWDELLGVMDDLARIGLDIFTIGQYLQPTREHLPVRRFYTPDEFATLRDEAKRRGIRYVQSGPLVRSSYRAEEPFEGSGASGPAIP